MQQFYIWQFDKKLPEQFLTHPMFISETLRFLWQWKMMNSLWNLWGSPGNFDDSPRRGGANKYPCRIEQQRIFADLTSWSLESWDIFEIEEDQWRQDIASGMVAKFLGTSLFAAYPALPPRFGATITHFSVFVFYYLQYEIGQHRHITYSHIEIYWVMVVTCAAVIFFRSGVACAKSSCPHYSSMMNPIFVTQIFWKIMKASCVVNDSVLYLENY